MFPSHAEAASLHCTALQQSEQDKDILVTEIRTQNVTFYPLNNFFTLNSCLATANYWTRSERGLPKPLLPPTGAPRFATENPHF